MREYNKTYEMEAPLKRAQAHEKNMIANVMAQALGISSPGIGENNTYQQQSNNNATNDTSMLNNVMQNGGQQSPAQPGMSLVSQAANVTKQPTGDMQQPIYPKNQPQENTAKPNFTPENKQKAIDTLISLGYMKETPAQQKAREVETNYLNKLSDADIKEQGEWGKTITAGHALMPVLEHIQDITANPLFQEAYSHPEFFGRDIDWISRFGKNKDQVDLLTSFVTDTKNIYSSLGKEFSGAMREFEFKLFKAVAPGEHDTLQQIISKNNTTLALKKLITDRLSLAKQITRQSMGKISNEDALNMADETIHTKDVFKKVKDQFETSQKEQLELKKMKCLG